MPPDPPGLARRLTTADAVVLGVGAMVGAGIFAAPGPAAAVASGRLAARARRCEARRRRMELPQDPLLRACADHLEGLRWAALLVDDAMALRWMSTELREFVGLTPDADIGVGRHLVEEFFRAEWARTVVPSSQIRMFHELAPFLVDQAARTGERLDSVLPDAVAAVLRDVEPAPQPDVWSTGFDYRSPTADAEIADYRVNIFFLRLRRDDGGGAGWVLLFFMGLRPNLLALLGRGDEAMYERMAKLVEPGQHAAAILFCDLTGSGLLSRRLPSAGYFRLVRALWTGIDAAVAHERGIVGKHAGDGATAFFLVEDLGTPSAAAAAAIRTARAIHDQSARVFAEVAGSEHLMKVGVHWGAGLYMGQLVPGGRLDVTALGDEVNEAARIQEAAAPHQTLASKQLVERLVPHDAAALGIDPARLTYASLAEIAPHDEKVVRDAGIVAVTDVSSAAGRTSASSRVD